jgi:AcrR family transcriptional regulator
LRGTHICVARNDGYCGPGDSPRTYNNYVSSREEAICGATATERAGRIGAELRERPPGEPLAEAVVNAMVAQYCGAEPDQRRICLVSSTPALRGEFLRTVAAIEQPLAEAIAQRAGLDVDTELYPRVLAGALSGAARAATEQWLRSGAHGPLAAVLREALTWVATAVHAAATPDPATSSVATVPSSPGEPEC